LDNCPDSKDQHIFLLDENIIEQDLEWEESLDGFDKPWNCKYHIQTSMSLDPFDSGGYVMVQAE
jgi:hypothetical protein